MGKRKLANLSRIVGAFVCPVPKGGSETVSRDVCMPRLVPPVAYGVAMHDVTLSAVVASGSYVCET